MEYKEITTVFYIGILLALLNPCECTRCFHCDHEQYPHNCERVFTCRSDEVCYTQQVVTSTMNVAFNSGCRQKSRCYNASTSLVGKRSEYLEYDIPQDIVTCTECCEQDFCNMKGCGVEEIPRSHRGPYCFTCEQGDPQRCNNITMCRKDELCLLYTSVSKGSQSTNHSYKSLCVKQAQCDVLAHGLGDTKQCDPVCCNKDFCNGRCRHP